MITLKSGMITEKTVIMRIRFAGLKKGLQLCSGERREGGGLGGEV
jgi:hypothetical protein